MSNLSKELIKKIADVGFSNTVDIGVNIRIKILLK